MTWMGFLLLLSTPKSKYLRGPAQQSKQITPSNPKSDPSESSPILAHAMGWSWFDWGSSPQKRDFRNDERLELVTYMELKRYLLHIGVREESLFGINNKYQLVDIASNARLDLEPLLVWVTPEPEPEPEPEEEEEEEEEVPRREVFVARTLSEAIHGQRIEPPAVVEDGDPFVKYRKMLKVGVPRQVVVLALQQETDLDPAGLEEVEPSIAQPGPDFGVLMKDDPRYAKYYKMVKFGVPRHVVGGTFQQETGLDPSLLDSPDAPVAQVHAWVGTSDEGAPPLPPPPQPERRKRMVDDERYAKFYRMLKVRRPWGDARAPSAPRLPHP